MIGTMRLNGRVIIRSMAVLSLLTLAASPSGVGAAPTYPWLQFDGSPQHSGANLAETALSPTTVSSLTRLFQVTLPSTADGAPAYLNAVSTPSGVKDLLFVTTKAGHLLALDAHSGSQVWSRQYGAGTCAINKTGGSCYTTSSPAIDPSRQSVYSYGLDGAVHKYAVGDGTEVTTGGWPELTTTKGYDEKGSSALSIATAASGTAYLYVAHAGYPGDAGDYQGHITTINLSTGAQTVFNTVCSNQAVHFVETPGSPDCSQVQSAVWARPGVVYDPDTNRIYFATGNATYDPANHHWGDSVLALNPDGSGANGNPLDSYTPTNYAYLDTADLDLGSTAPAILPPVPGSSVAHLGMQGGKDQRLRLLNLDDLSGQGGPGHTGGEVGTYIPAPLGAAVLTTPAVWTNPADGSVWAFVADYSGISGIKITADATGTPVMTAAWTNSTGGTSPIIANGVLYYASNNTIQALNPTTGAQLWHDTTIGGIHWQSPIVANGALYITDNSNHLTAYTLPLATVPLAAGWNALGMPNSQDTTASALKSEIESQNAGMTVQSLATYTAGRYTVYLPGYSPAMALSPGQGVDALLSGSSTWRPQGNPGGPTTLSLQQGWNFVALTSPDSLDAATICTEVTAAGRSCQQVAQYSGGSYRTYTPATGSTTFTVQRGTGFWVLTSSAGPWTPS